MVVCDRCGEHNPSGGRFCSSCGAPLPEQRASGLEVRKTVTILFCDAVGSTALGEATDPETTRRVMGRYAETMAEIVRQFGGTVERFRGDEVMAVFGVPVVHEDDALRAVRAAREMQRSLAALNDELLARWGVELACRIGINTGEVVAGDPSTGETFVTGDAVNLAKRLEQAAEPGGILIGTATYPLVKDAVTVGPRERFSAKGKRDGADRMRLDDVHATAAGYERRLDAPLVGRERELAALERAIRSHLDEGSCGLLTLLGPAGVGKSRLAREVTSRLGDDMRVAFGRCLAYGAGITYWPLVELVEELGGLDTVALTIGADAEAKAALEHLRAAVGDSDAAAGSPELLWGVRRVLEEIAREKPLLVCLEDIHWAEPRMLDLLEYVVAFGSGPIVILCNARPDLLETRPGFARYTLLDLAPLSETETSELVASLGVTDAEALRSIAATADGNPLFAEQLAAMVLETRDGHDRTLVLPASIHALLAARLDVLAPDERRVLERASVIGKEFWHRAVADLSSSEERDRVAGCMLALSRKGFVTPVRRETPGEDTFSFRHALIRDVTYAGIPKSVRANLHEGFARWLEAQPGFREHDEIVGYHAEQAHMYLSELAPTDARTQALAGLAAHRLGIAGRRALSREDVPAATLMLERALALLESDASERSAILVELGSAAIRSGEWDRARTLLEEGVASARRSGDRRSELRATIELQWQKSYTEPSRAAEEDREVAETVIPDLEEVDDQLGLAKAWWLLSESHGIACHWAARAEALEQAIVHARRAGDDGQLRVLVVLYAQALHHGPTPVPEAIRRCTQLLEEHPAAPTFEAGLGTTLAGLRAMEGSFAEARRLYAASIAVYEEFGLRFRRAVRSIVGAQIESLAGDLDAAEHELRTGYAMLEEMGEQGVRSTLAGFLADVLSLRADDLEAERFVAITRATAAEQDVVPQVLWRRAAARTTARLGDPAGAELLAREAVERASTTDFLDLRAGTQLVLAESLRDAGRAIEATEGFEEARSLYERKGNVAARGFQAVPGSPA